MSENHFIVQTTTDSESHAGDLVVKAVTARLAAGGHVSGPVRSTYWWDGEVRQAQEWVVWFETSAARVDDLAAFTTANHHYVTPAVSVLPIVGGSEEFLRWIGANTARAHL